MASEALTLKYRPRVFEDVIGQDVLVSFCSNLIKRGQQGRNLLIAGPWGSGKTTTARIYSQALHCEAPTASGSPCHQCESCSYYQTDPISHPDYREFDGSSQGRIDQIKSELEIAKTPPIFSKKRIFVIDEAQGVSRQGFDAMLKLVEEPPPHLTFIFLTTEADKIRPAIKSRCASLGVKLLDNPTARTHLEKICTKEGFKFEPAALDLITFISQGHPRDLLKNLQQVAEFGDITLEETKRVFSLGYGQYLVKYTNALLDRNVREQIAIMRDWAESSERKVYLLQEFFVFLYHHEILKIPATVNPVLKLIPEGDRRSIVAKFKERADAEDKSLDSLWGAIANFWTEVGYVANEVVLDLWLHKFDNLVNIHNFTSSATLVREKLKPEARLMTSPTHQGRRFTETSNPLMDGGAPPPAAPSRMATVAPVAPVAAVVPVTPTQSTPAPAPIAEVSLDAEPVTTPATSKPDLEPSPSWSMSGWLNAESVTDPTLSAATAATAAPVVAPVTPSVPAVGELAPEPLPTVTKVFPHHLNTMRGFKEPVPLSEVRLTEAPTS